MRRHRHDGVGRWCAKLWRNNPSGSAQENANDCYKARLWSLWDQELCRIPSKNAVMDTNAVTSKDNESDSDDAVVLEEKTRDKALRPGRQRRVRRVLNQMTDCPDRAQTPNLCKTWSKTGQSSDTVCVDDHRFKWVWALMRQLYSLPKTHMLVWTEHGVQDLLKGTCVRSGSDPGNDLRSGASVGWASKPHLSAQKQTTEHQEARLEPAVRKEGTTQRQLGHAHGTPAGSPSQMRHRFAQCHDMIKSSPAHTGQSVANPCHARYMENMVCAAFGTVRSTTWWMQQMRPTVPPPKATGARSDQWTHMLFAFWRTVLSGWCVLLKDLWDRKPLKRVCVALAPFWNTTSSLWWNYMSSFQRFFCKENQTSERSQRHDHYVLQKDLNQNVQKHSIHTFARREEPLKVLELRRQSFTRAIFEHPSNNSMWTNGATIQACCGYLTTIHMCAFGSRQCLHVWLAFFKNKISWTSNPDGFGITAFLAFRPSFSKNKSLFFSMSEQLRNSQIRAAALSSVDRWSWVPICRVSKGERRRVDPRTHWTNGNTWAESQVVHVSFLQRKGGTQTHVWIWPENTRHFTGNNRCFHLLLWSDNLAATIYCTHSFR